MKNYLLSGLLGFAAIISTPVHAAVAGNVSINPNGLTATGEFTASPSSISGGNISSLFQTGPNGSSVIFYFADASGQFFRCSVGSRSSLYQAAMDIANTLGNGSRLSVVRNSATGDTCTSLEHIKSSSLYN